MRCLLVWRLVYLYVLDFGGKVLFVVYRLISGCMGFSFVGVNIFSVVVVRMK